MPRETITSDHDDGFDLTVGWERDHELAQVGVLLPPGENLVGRLLGGDERILARIGEQFVNHMRERGDEFLLPENVGNDAMLEHYRRIGGLFVYWAQEARGWVGERDGLWFTITQRSKTNVLIRFVKKARDVSFGRDE